MTGTAGQKRVPNEYFALNPFPLPPLVEQRRIVERVDQLMAICDTLEQRQAQQRGERQRLLNALIGALLSAASPRRGRCILGASARQLRAGLRHAGERRAAAPGRAAAGCAGVAGGAGLGR